MARGQRHQRWLAGLFCGVIGCGLPWSALAADLAAAARAEIKVIFLIKGDGQAGSQAVENTLTQAFQGAGYNVLDAAMVAHIMRRDADVLQRYDIEAAKHFGSRVGADIVVSGEVKNRAVDKSYTLLEGKKVTISQAQVDLKAILVSSGKVVAAESARSSRPFDIVGGSAQQRAAETLAAKLLQGIEQFLARDTIDYRLVVFNVDHLQAWAFQEGVRDRVQGVRRVGEPGFRQNLLELDVSVDKVQDLSFKNSVFAGLSSLGLGRFEVVAREREAIYLRKSGDTPRPQPNPTKSLPPPVPEPQPVPHSPDLDSRKPPAKAPSPERSTGRPANAPVSYNSWYGKSWAVVIGINEYQHWPKLRYAVNDARAVEQVLKRLGFNEVITVFDAAATQQGILRIIGDELYDKTQDEDRVLIFFAGHGQTQDLPRDEKVGYIIPADGDLKNYYSTAISMQRLQEIHRRIRAKHVFYAIDACFSGLLLNLRGAGAGEGSVLQRTKEPARQVLTAGGQGEKAFELEGHGLFTKALLAGLQGQADRDGDGYITATELYEFVGRRVQEDSRHMQNPQFGPLEFGRGEFVFGRK